MRLFRTHREMARRRWRYFGRPVLILFGIAAVIGLLAGAVWVIAGLLNMSALR